MKSDWAFIKLKTFFKPRLHQARTYLGQQVLFHTSSFFMFYLAMRFFFKKCWSAGRAAWFCFSELVFSSDGFGGVVFPNLKQARSWVQN